MARGRYRRIPTVEFGYGAVRPEQALLAGITPYLTPPRPQTARAIETALNMMMRERLAEAQTQRFLLGLQAQQERFLTGLQWEIERRRLQEIERTKSIAKRDFLGLAVTQSGIFNKYQRIINNLPAQTYDDILANISTMPDNTTIQEQLGIQVTPDDLSFLFEFAKLDWLRTVGEEPIYDPIELNTRVDTELQRLGIADPKAKASFFVKLARDTEQRVTKNIEAIKRQTRPILHFFGLTR